MYPIGAVAVSEKAGKWLKEDGWAHMSTFGGSELGCRVAKKVLEITQRKETVDNVHYLSDHYTTELTSIMKDSGGFFKGMRHRGVIFGLEFDHPEGAKPVMRRLYENGVWAIFSALDASVLQFKVGLLYDKKLNEDLLERVAVAIKQAKNDI